MKKILKILIAFLLFASLSYGQALGQQAQYKNGGSDLFISLSKRFAEEMKKNKWPECEISVVFVKFTIDSAGKVSTLVFSELKGTPQVFRNVLEIIIRETSGHWIPRKINGKAVESKPFILPLLYDLESGCSVKDSGGKLVYDAIPNSLSTALFYILHFEDNVGSKETQLDCTLLNPLIIESIN